MFLHASRRMRAAMTHPRTFKIICARGFWAMGVAMLRKVCPPMLGMQRGKGIDMTLHVLHFLSIMLRGSHH